jgi:uncharacterized protein YjbI with pentapeptide repeats
VGRDVRGIVMGYRDGGHMAEEHDFERWREIRAVHKENANFYRMLRGGVIIGLFVFIGWIVFQESDEPRAFGMNLWTEIAGIAVTVLIIDLLNEMRAERRYKQQLVDEAASTSNEIAKHAVHVMRRRGWLQGTNSLLQRVNLQGANLEYADLSGANMQGSKLTGANLQHALLLGANIQDAELSRAKLQHAELAFANLQRSSALDSDFRDANLRGTDLRYSKISSSDFRNANFANANLENADMRYTDMRNAKLASASLHNTDISRSNLEDISAPFANFSGSNLQGSDLSKAGLLGSNLRRANLQSSNMVEADIRGVDLTDADLTEANLRNSIIGYKVKVFGIGYEDAPIFSTRTKLPNGSNWESVLTDLNIFINPEHNDFWRSSVVGSPAYRIEEYYKVMLMETHAMRQRD